MFRGWLWFLLHHGLQEDLVCSPALCVPRRQLLFKELLFTYSNRRHRRSRGRTAQSVFSLSFWKEVRCSCSLAPLPFCFLAAGGFHTVLIFCICLCARCMITSNSPTSRKCLAKSRRSPSIVLLCDLLAENLISSVWEYIKGRLSLFFWKSKMRH